ncbi:MAG: hypothetical protein KIT11_03245 [Fimbriimonadaceae bacterium]|nr:hypothetical protein [Fimbriimonadaceae bacterium]QYK57087.1 MAG: hypothetical protein KF733_06280 [Fimbriimonadaceae bacterium]
MAKILIAYATSYGQTAKIAAKIADWANARGHEAVLFDTGARNPEPDLTGFDAIVLAGSIVQARHQTSLVSWAKRNASASKERPSLFLSVSMSAHGTEPRHRQDVAKCIRGFLEETGWCPTLSLPVAGALAYRKYGWLIRLMMRRIVAKEGGDTDTSRDYEYTDWAKLEGDFDAFLRALPEGAPSLAEPAATQ